MLQKDVGKILEATLSTGADARLKVLSCVSYARVLSMHYAHCILCQMQSLQNMYEYLLDAESRMEKDKASNDDNNPSADGTSVPVAAGAGDTNICGGIVQLYWNSILARCLDANEHVRQAALKVFAK